MGPGATLSGVADAVIKPDDEANGRGILPVDFFRWTQWVVCEGDCALRSSARKQLLGEHNPDTEPAAVDV